MQLIHYHGPFTHHQTLTVFEEDDDDTHIRTTVINHIGIETTVRNRCTIPLIAALALVNEDGTLPSNNDIHNTVSSIQQDTDITIYTKDPEAFNSQKIQTFKIPDSGILEFNNLFLSNATIVFNKDLPIETTIEIGIKELH